MSKNTLKDSDNLPAHIAIIMDGNGRWAKKRGLPRVAGHREGIKSVREIVEVCGELGVEVLVPEMPQIVAALGAAVIAQENIEKGAS